MTDEQIEKALECCTTWNGCRNECPYDSKCDGIFDCATRLAQDALALIKRQRAEIRRLEYTLLGVMHSVDKWLEGDELKQDEVNRAITMREKTLHIVESLQAEKKLYDDRSFQEEMWSVLGDMTYAQAREAVRWLNHKYDYFTKDYRKPTDGGTEMTGYLILSIFFGCLSQISCAPTWVSIMLTIASGACIGVAIMEEVKLRVKVEALERLLHACQLELRERRNSNERQVD